jgi:hypothetical protein
MEVLAPSAVRGYLAHDIELGRLAALWLRLRVVLSSGRLTRRLADGADAVESRELALRARQLTAPAFRAALASSLDNVLERAARPRPLVSSQVPLDRTKVRAAGEEIAGLSARLRSPEPVRAQGVAQALLLLTDPELPLHGDAGPDRLAHAIIELNERLDAPRQEDAW